MARTVAVEGGSILVGNEPFHIRSGAMHYFRIHPDQWRDRLVKLRQCGLNTVETYLAWNLHEPREGEFRWDGALDFAAFLRLAHAEGLKAMVRPGPYICSEWDLGGMPAWLLAKPGMRLRCSNPAFVAAARPYLLGALERLKPLQHTEGGPVLMMQIENEYGSHGTDRAYLEALKNLFDEAGVAVPLFTSDGATARHLAGGTLPGVLATINFRNRPADNFPALENFRPGAPRMTMELWVGGGHHWGRPFPEHDAEGVRADIAELMDKGDHFNLYMFHGGRNPGFMNGANFFDNAYHPFLSSYDVDAPLNEEGDPTPKYFAVREEILKRAPGAAEAMPVAAPKRAYGAIALSESAALLDALPALAQPVRSASPEPMETFGQAYGFILYRTRLTVPGVQRLCFLGLKDRAVALVDGAVAGVAYRNDANPSVFVGVPEGGATLDVLVENMGRLNFGLEMEQERKGLTGVAVEGCGLLHGWEIFPLPMDDLSRLPFVPTPAGAPLNQPAFYRGVFEIDEPADTFFKVPDGVKGAVWINGEALGRYWHIGPQRALYVPAPLLKRGPNTVVVFEAQGMGAPPTLLSLDRRDFGPTARMQI